MRETIEEKIERIALLSFSQQGYNETKTSELAKNAGVSETSIFRLFKTKKDLYLHVLSKYGNTVKLNQNSIYSSLSFEDIKEDLTLIALKFIHFYFDNIHLTRIYLSNAIQIHEILGYEFLIYPELKDFLKNYMDEMETRGKLSKAPTTYFIEIFLSSIAQDVISMTTFKKLESLDEVVIDNLQENWVQKVNTLLNLFDISTKAEQ